VQRVFCASVADHVAAVLGFGPRSENVIRNNTEDDIQLCLFVKKCEQCFKLCVDVLNSEGL
jgi:hypothetical protein